MIEIDENLAIPDSEIALTFIRSGGPGGQNVNKVATAVQLRFDVRNSPSLPQRVRERMERLAGSRATKEGVIVLTANSHRTQEANRREAIDRLAAMIRAAKEKPKRRVATRPSLAAKKRRLEAKSRRAAVKRLRRSGPDL